MSAHAPARAASTGSTFLPARHRVTARQEETGDVVTLLLEPLDEPLSEPRPGQFNMLTAFGVGEAAISWSGVPGAGGPLRHTVRDVGPISHALCSAPVGAELGVRGPFGTDWGLGSLEGADAVVVAGGLGLAPLFGAVSLLAERQRRGDGRLFLAVGARSPDQLLFRDALDSWAASGAEVATTVDLAAPGWKGAVGLVTQLLPQLGFSPERAVALLCGPEIMMRFSARALDQLGIAPARVRCSLERNMQCGVGLCGHCQLGPYLLCRDGPVLPYGGLVAELMTASER